MASNSPTQRKDAQAAHTQHMVAAPYLLDKEVVRSRGVINAVVLLQPRGSLTPCHDLLCTSFPVLPLSRHYLCPNLENMPKS